MQNFNGLNVGQIIDALNQCNCDDIVVFFDSDKEQSYKIVFVEQTIWSDTRRAVYLHRYIPELDNIACEPIKSVFDRSLTFAKTEWKTVEE